jgi:hypothetical protein
VPRTIPASIPYNVFARDKSVRLIERAERVLVEGVMRKGKE